MSYKPVIRKNLSFQSLLSFLFIWIEQNTQFIDGGLKTNFCISKLDS